MPSNTSASSASAIEELATFEKEAEALAASPKTYHVKSAVISTLRGIGLENNEIQAVVFPHATAEKLDEVGPTLDTDASDRAYRLARVILMANRVFGDSQKAFLWLRMNNPQIGGKTPIASLETETGSRLVEELLIRIDHGIAA